MAWSKAKTAVVVGVSVLLAMGTTTVVVETVYQPEPTYQGKPLSEWTKVFFQRTKTGYQTSRGGESADAIKHMGKKAVPTLLRMVGAKKPYRGIPQPDVQMQAVGGFCALGPVAEGAIPELDKLVNQPEFVWGAAQSLAGISPKAVAPLIHALSNTNPSVRVFVASALGGGFRSGVLEKAYLASASGANKSNYVAPEPPLGSDVTAAIDALIQCTKDSDKTVRAVATSAGNITQNPDVVLPVLLQVLGDADPQCRRMAAQAIGFFGKQARIAIPDLTIATNDSDSNVQRLAKEALDRIENGLAPKQSPTGKNNSR